MSLGKRARVFVCASVEMIFHYCVNSWSLERQTLSRESINCSEATIAGMMVQDNRVEWCERNTTVRSCINGTKTTIRWRSNPIIAIFYPVFNFISIHCNLFFFSSSSIRGEMHLFTDKLY